MTATTLSETEKNHEERIRKLEGANLALTSVLTQVLFRVGSADILDGLADYFIARDVENGGRDYGRCLLAMKHLESMRAGLTPKPQPERIDA